MFSELALLKVRLHDLDGLILDETFSANGVTLRMAVAEPQIGVLQQQLADLSRGRITLHRLP